MQKLIRSLLATTLAVTLSVALAPVASSAPLNWSSVFEGPSQKIYRSGEIHKGDASTLKSRGVTTIVAYTGSNPHISGVNFVKVKMSGLGVGGVSTAKGVSLYKKFVTTSRRNALGRALIVIANAPGSVVVQCWKGKDRTGWTVAILGHILGQSESQMIREFVKYRPGKSSWLKASLNEAEKKYGSLDGFLDKIGVTAEVRDLIRSKYAEPSTEPTSEPTPEPTP